MEQTWLCSPGEVACGAWGPLRLLLCQQSADTCQAATLAGSGQSQSLELGTGDAWEPGPLWSHVVLTVSPSVRRLSPFTVEETEVQRGTWPAQAHRAGGHSQARQLRRVSLGARFLIAGLSLLCAHFLISVKRMDMALRLR